MERDWNGVLLVEQKSLRHKLDKAKGPSSLSPASRLSKDPVNIKASELVGRLHDDLHASGYTGQDLE